MVINPIMGNWYTPVPAGQGNLAQPSDPAPWISNATPWLNASAGQMAQQQQGQAQSDDALRRTLQAIDEARERYREESDREYQLRVQGLQNQREQIAISRSQQEANEWYNRQMVEVTRAKLEEDKRQFDLGEAEKKRQFDITENERARQFDLSTEEGRRQFDLTSAERARQFNVSTALQESQYGRTLAEQQRQFNTGQSGYLNGAPTLERERMQNQGLMDWTKMAIEAGNSPASWVNLRKMQLGAQADPSLDWTRGTAQIGNTAFAGEPEAGGVGNILSSLGVPQGGGMLMQPPGYATDPYAGQPAQPSPSQPSPGGQIQALPYSQVAPQGMLGGYGYTTEADYAWVLEQLRAKGQLAPAAPQSSQPNESWRGSGGGEMNYAGGTPGWLNPNAAAQKQAMFSGQSEATGRGTDRGGQEVYAGTVAQQNEAGGQPMNWALAAANQAARSTANQGLNLTTDERAIWDTARSFGTNPQQAGLGWFEQQDPLTKDLLKGAAQGQGLDWNSVMSRYNRSRWGAGTGSSRAA